MKTAARNFGPSNATVCCVQHVESELARLRLQVGSTEHSQAALEATVQGQLDACVHHVEKRLFKAAQAKVSMVQPRSSPWSLRTVQPLRQHW